MTRQPISADPDPATVARVTFVPFMPGGGVALLPAPHDGSFLPSGGLLPDEHYLDAALRIPLEVAGFRMQSVHPFALDGDHLYLWLEGDRYRGRRPHANVDLDVRGPDEAARLLRDRGAGVDGAIVAEAIASYRGQTDESYYSDKVRLLERGYLAAGTPEGGSGFGGDAVRWRARREQIVAGIDHDGTFLDVGCANGFLMESVERWAAERGLHIEPYGVDLGPQLIELARSRLPRWADRVWVGNAVDWVAPNGMTFDYVHVLLDLVPERAQRRMLEHALEHLTAPGGRLLVSQYGGDGGTLSDAGEVVRKLGFTVAGEAFPVDDAHCAGASVAWIDRG